MEHGDCYFAANNDTNLTYHICAYETASLYDTFILGSDVDMMWILLAGFLVFFMQGGFTMLEAGMVKYTNVQNILFKNIMDACIGCITFFLFGYCIAYGNDEYSNGFMGTSDVAISSGDYNGFFFQWAFAATAATIVSGSVAERCRLDAYFVYTMALTVWVYPVVVHWCWSNTGFLSPFNDDAAIEGGVIDFAGSGVVHMVGGWSGLCGAFFLGPRLNRFSKTSEDSAELQVQIARQFKLGHNVSMQAMGTLILWFGWFGFNCGSTLAASGAMELASKVAVNTTMSAASGGIIVACLEKYCGGLWCVPAICNGVLASLVSITAPCAVVKPSTAIVIGCIGGALCWGSSKLLEKFKIDDPLDAFPVHGICGAWGVISVGIFAFDQDDIAFAGYDSSVSQSQRLGSQFLAVVVIALWCLFNGMIIFGGLSFFKVLRVDSEEERNGLDYKEHGGAGYAMQHMTYSKEQQQVIEKLVRKAMVSTSEGVNKSHANVASQSTASDAGFANSSVAAPTTISSEREPTDVEMEKRE